MKTPKKKTAADMIFIEPSLFKSMSGTFWHQTAYEDLVGPFTTLEEAKEALEEYFEKLEE